MYFQLSDNVTRLRFTYKFKYFDKIFGKSNDIFAAGNYFCKSMGSISALRLLLEILGIKG